MPVPTHIRTLTGSFVTLHIEALYQQQLVTVFLSQLKCKHNYEWITLKNGLPLHFIHVEMSKSF